MNHISPPHLLQSLEWRYATKIFDPAKKIPAETWTALEKTLNLTPTSYGLQPFRFLVIDNPELRAQLLPVSWHQKQVVDADRFVVFTVRTAMTEADVDRYLHRAAEIRQTPAETFKGYRGIIVKNIVHGALDIPVREWASRQAYIALGNAMTAAALLGVDTCPMEGMLPAEYDRILGLTGTGYATVVALALGYRSATDKYASAPKVRYEVADIVRHL
jgi:nitroreductase